MKLTKEQLEQIIKEELSKLDEVAPVVAAVGKQLGAAALGAATKKAGEMGAAAVEKGVGAAKDKLGGSQGKQGMALTQINKAIDMHGAGLKTMPEDYAALVLKVLQLPVTNKTMILNSMKKEILALMMPQASTPLSEGK